MQKNPTALELIITPSGTAAAAKWYDANGNRLSDYEIEALLLQDEINDLGRRILRHISKDPTNV